MSKLPPPLHRQGVQLKYLTSSCEENSPLLSFIIPLYNAEKYIENCLNSIVTQNICQQLYEIIIVDDGSTDSGPNIISKFQKSYSHIQLIRQKNAGVSAARNKGMDVAGGKYLFFVDADDEVKENTLHQVFGILRNEDFEILSFEVNGDVDDFSITCRNSGINIFTKYDLYNGVWAYIFNRSFLDEHKLRFIDGMLSEDAAFVVDTFLLAENVLRIDAAVYCNIKRPNSITTSKDRHHLLLYAEKLQTLVYYLNDKIIAHRYIMTEQNFQAFCRRRDSFIMILFVRAMRAKIEDKEIVSIIHNLKNRKLYPYQKISDSCTYRLLTFVFNRPILYRLVAKIYRTIL